MGIKLIPIAHPNVSDATKTIPTTVGGAMSDPRIHPASAVGLNPEAGDLGWEGLDPVKNPSPYKLKK